MGKFISVFKLKHIRKLISPRSSRRFKYLGIGRSIDDLCTINDGNEFLNSFKYFNPKELELKIEHQRTHATFLEVDITIEDDIFVYKLYH